MRESLRADSLTAPRRWIRLDVGWDRSDWLADLPPGSRLAWVLLLGYVKTVGVAGSVKAMSSRGAARDWNIPEAEFCLMMEAAIRDGAVLKPNPETWEIAHWDRYQQDGAAERQRRHRADRSRLSPLRDVTEHSVTPVTLRTQALRSDETLTLTLTETKETSTDSSPSAPKRRGRTVVDQSPLFDELKAEYPKRKGGQGWQDARMAVERHLKAGVPAEAILAGTRRYAAFVRHEGNEGTSFVKQAMTFFGPGMHWAEEWHFNGNGKRPEPRAFLPGSAGSVLR